MKKILIIIGILLALLTALYLFLNQKEAVVKKLIVLEKNHAHIYRDDEYIQVPFFVNIEEIDLFDDISNVRIYASDKSTVFPIDEIMIDKIHNEVFDSQLFYGYKFLLKLPNIKTTYHMDDVLLSFNTPLKKYEFKIGTLDVLYKENINQFTFYSLEGTKQEFLPTLETIKVITDRFYEIDSIKVGNKTLIYEQNENNLTIKFDKSYFGLNNTFVEINYEGKTAYLPQFDYFSNYELLIYAKYQIHLI